jgi:SAM-dependent methyltransferase
MTYNYKPDNLGNDYRHCLSILQKRCDVTSGFVNHIDPASVAAVKNRLLHYATVEEVTVSIQQYQDYRTAARYETAYPDYYSSNLHEKSFEHYIAFRYLNPRKGDVFIDIASEGSPIPDIYASLSGCLSYRQDIMYPEGITGNRIGGDATNMPVSDSFADKISMTCSLEHFEGSGDIDVFREIGRVLKKGGMLSVVPLYMYEKAVNQTDPLISACNNVVFDEETSVYCTEGWANRFARFYSPESLYDRILKPHQEIFDFTILYFANATEIDASIYARFALLATRR